MEIEKTEMISYNIEELRNKSDADLVGFLYERASELHFGDYGDTLDSVDPALKEIYATIVLHDEVKYCGLEQFYINNGMSWARTARRGFERISAKVLSALIEQSIGLFSMENLSIDRHRRRALYLLENEISRFQGLQDLQVKYVRENYNLFTIN